MSYSIHINHKVKDGGPVDHEIYTKQEADDAGMVYVHWKEAVTGDWCLTDDDYVAEALKVSEYDGNQKHKNKYIRMPFGYVLYNPKYPTKKFRAIGRSTPHTYTGKPEMEVRSKQAPMKNLAVTYAQTMDKDLAIELAFPGGVNNNARGRYKRMMRTEVFGKMVREQLQLLLSEHGMTEAYTLDLLAEAIEMAKGKGDVTNILKAVDNLQTMHGMNEKNKVKTTQQIESTTRRLLDQIDEEEHKITATQITEKDEE